MANNIYFITTIISFTLLTISEILPFTKFIKSNGILESIVNIKKTSKLDSLKYYIDLGFKTGSFLIEDSIIINNYFRILNGQEKDENKDIYKLLINLLHHSNKKGAYTIDEAEKIHELITFIEQKKLKD